MIFRVSRIAGAPEFETLPVAKITSYPLEKADYKPFAQCCLCIGPESLALRMWAFEVNTSPQSELRTVLYPFREKPDRALHLRLAPPKAPATSNELAIWLEEDGERTPLIGTSHPHNGEDLQGVYWGSDVFLPLDQLPGELAFEAGEHFPGNFYKLRGGEAFAHSGSFAPADFPDRPFGRESMADFQVVPY